MRITPETLRIIRQVYRLTLEDMAALLDTSTAGIWRIENGERPLTADMIAKIRKEFDLTADKIQHIYEVYYEFGGQASRRVRPVIVAV